MVDDSNDYHAFFRKDESEVIDLSHEVEEMMKMNNKNRAHKAIIEDIPVHKPLFDIPERQHYEKCYGAVVDSRNHPIPTRGPGFTDLTDRVKINYSRQSHSLGESFLY